MSGHQAGTDGAGGGPALVLLPGFMADASLWDDMREALEGFGPVLHGELGQDDSIMGMAQRVLASTPCPSFVLIGFSMGGYVAREVARMAPERVAALVLVATSARGDTPEQERRKQAGARGAAKLAFRGLSRVAIASSLHRDRAGDEAMIARVRTMGERLGRDVFLRQSMLARIGDADRLGEIRCPTLVVAAAQDRLRSLEEAAELRDGIPGAEMRIVDPSGHMVPLENPRMLAATVLSWLRTLPSLGGPEAARSAAGG
jgi:pimeloyl-ACP methyl ester carboxylesterase